MEIGPSRDRIADARARIEQCHDKIARARKDARETLARAHSKVLDAILLTRLDDADAAIVTQQLVLASLRTLKKETDVEIATCEKILFD